MISRPVRPLLLAAAVWLTACSDTGSSTAPRPISAARDTGTYVVLLRDTTTAASAVVSRLTQSLPSFRVAVPVAVSGVNARIVSDSSPAEVLPALHAAVMRVTAEDAAQLRTNPAVAAVEPVRTMHLAAVTTPTTIPGHSIASIRSPCHSMVA